MTGQLPCLSRISGFANTVMTSQRRLTPGFVLGATVKFRLVYERQNLFLARLASSDWSTNARICSWREWEAWIGLLTDKENLPTNTENKVRYSQLLLLSSLFIL